MLRKHGNVKTPNIDELASPVILFRSQSSESPRADTPLQIEPESPRSTSKFLKGLNVGAMVKFYDSEKSSMQDRYFHHGRKKELNVLVALQK